MMQTSRSANGAPRRCKNWKILTTKLTNWESVLLKSMIPLWPKNTTWAACQPSSTIDARSPFSLKVFSHVLPLSNSAIFTKGVTKASNPSNSFCFCSFLLWYRLSVVSDVCPVARLDRVQVNCPRKRMCWSGWWKISRPVTKRM